MKTLQKYAASVLVAGSLAALPAMALADATTTPDTTPPTVTLSTSAPDPTGFNIPVTATFSEDVQGFSQSSLDVSNATVANFAATSNSATFTLVPSSAGAVTATINEHKFTDLAGNQNASSTSLTRTYDPTLDKAPTITFTSGPTEGSTSTTATTTFAFNTDIPSTFGCSLNGGFYLCGSPQNFALPNGSYTFVVFATSTGDTAKAASSTIDFIVAIDTPVISEVTPVPTPSASQTPQYVIFSNEAGTAVVGGSCSVAASTTLAVGTSTITFNTLSPGTYSDCTVAVQNASGNLSNVLSLSPFTINASQTPSNTSSGGGGGGGGYVVSGPLSIGYVNTNPTGGVVLGTSTSANSSAGSGQAASTTCFVFSRHLNIGSRGADVTALQQRLTQEGVYTGPITGYFGNLTFAGVKAFQTKHGISSMGEVGPLTRGALNICFAQ